MSRNFGRMWIVLVAFGIVSMAPMAVAQDVTGEVVTDTPAPIADGVATFTGTYTNLGPGAAESAFMDYYIGISPGIWTDEGNAAFLQSAEFSDVNGNQAFIYIDGSNCNHYILELAQPGDGSVAMFPIAANEGGSFTFGLPVVPMEGIDSGRVIVTEPESLRNAFTPMDAYYFVDPYSNYWKHAGEYDFVFQGGHCDDVPDPSNPDAACWDIEQCFGARLWAIEPFEADLVLADDGGVEGDPALACGPFVNADDVAGKIALLRRGVCPFYDKVVNAQDAGAIGMIMVNDGRCSDEPDADPDECVVGMATSVPTTPGLGYFTNIPFVQMGRRQGEELITAYEDGMNPRAAMGPIADPDGYEPIGVFAADDGETADQQANNFTVWWPMIGEMGPSQYASFVAAAAYAEGAEGAFFVTDAAINNKGTTDATVTFGWLPRGADNSEFVTADPITLTAGHSMQFENVLNALFGAEPPAVGGLVMITDSADVIGMTRTYNLPGAKVAGTFGQALPAVPADQFIATGEKQRIIFMSENDDIRANVGCINARDNSLRINIELFDAEGTSLEIKTMDLGPWSNNQINRVFRDYGPVNGYVDVWTDTADSDFYCYGSVLDNQTSDPTTVLPQVPSDTMTFVPAAAVAAGAQGAFFQTDVDLNNAGSDPVEYQFIWLPRGQDNSTPTTSDTFTLGAGMGVRYENVLTEVFGAEPDSVGALALSADTMDLLTMTRTYNIPGAKVAGTFGQALPGIPMNQMIQTGVTKRIIFMNENDDTRANVGCVNGMDQAVRVTIDMYDADGMHLETKFMDLGPWSNNQLNRVFRDYAPVNGYVDVSTTTAGSYIYCYGSVLDNLTSDPTTVMPQ